MYIHPKINVDPQTVVDRFKARQAIQKRTRLLLWDWRTVGWGSDYLIAPT